MTYTQFKATVKENGWTVSQLRCDEPPTEALLDFMSVVGLGRYERYVLRLIGN